MRNSAGASQLSKREKRKSEVLIAAQSLDQEVKHVKNLKRLSIGSMDLLVDPEMEFRVSKHAGTKPVESLAEDKPVAAFEEISLSPDVSFEEEGEGNNYNDNENEDSYSFTDDSMDITNAEYLDQNPSSLIQNSYRNEPLPRRRILGSSSSSPNSFNKEDSSSGESLGQNLLWVRADQHPNVKPENYLELVQNTLEHLNFEDENTESQAQSLAEMKTLRRRSLQSKNSLARRPSRLRTSYTELSEEEELVPMSVPMKEPRRTISLKDITEELTKLSNQAGLTDTDAVTLARTLRVADDSSEDSSQRTSITDMISEDEEFASNMLIKNGLSFPTRHSLRRSKFNTYRIQSSGQPSLEEKKPDLSNNLTNSPSSLLNSPNSIIGMYNDENSNEKSPIVKEFFSTLPANDELESESSTEDADSSTDISNELLLVTTNDKAKTEGSQLNWKWTASVTGSSDKKIQQVQTVSTETISPRKINHSRNRHIKTASKSISDETDKLLPEITSRKVKKTNQSQNKFMKFFKKRSNSDHKKKDSDPTVIPPEKELKKKQSSSSLSNKFRMSPKKLNKSESNKEQQLKFKEGSIISNYGKEKSTVSTPSLQPAVTVIKAKAEQPSQSLVTSSNNNSTTVTNTISAHKENEDNEYDVEVTEFSLQEDSFNSIGSQPGQDSELRGFEETTQNSSTQIGPSEQRYPLPPRKLTFDDVVKPEKPNAPMKFTDSAFGFPLPPLTISTVIMFDHRLPIHVERAIYRLSHLKLSDPKRVLRQQVLLSNFMYSYLNLVNHSLYLQQVDEEKVGTSGNNEFRTGLIDIPDI